MRLNNFAKHFILSALSLLAGSLLARESREHIFAGGQQREFVLYLPTAFDEDRDKSFGFPVVILLHGFGGNAEGIKNLTGMEVLAEKEKFIAVFPEGIDKRWNDGRDRKDTVDDVEFISKLIKLVVSGYGGNSERIFVAGFSNGGFMTMRLACELSNKIAAVAAVGATIDTTIEARCKITIPVSVMLIHGTKDPIVSIEGGNIKRLPDSYVLSHQALIASWKQRNQCGSPPSIKTIPDKQNDGTVIIRTSYLGGKNGSEVVGYVVRDGGHTWPGSQSGGPNSPVGKTTGNLNATEVIWEFFKTHPKR